MSKLQVQIIKPTTPNEKFHILENTTELDQMPNDNTWDLIKLCLNHSDLNLRILGVYLNAVMTENKLTHLLSGRILIKLLKSQNLISRKTLSNQHASEIVNWFEEQGHIKILKPAGFKVAGVVTVTVDEVVEFVNKVLGEEVSNQYTESVLGFYKGVDEECQKELASTPVADDVSEEEVSIILKRDADSIIKFFKNKRYESFKQMIKTYVDFSDLMPSHKTKLITELAL